MNYRLKRIRRMGAAWVLVLGIGALSPVRGQASTNALTMTGRNVFYEKEVIALQLSAVGESTAVTFTGPGGVRRVVQAPVADGMARLTLLPLALSPGMWTVSAGAATGSLTIASSIRGTPYTFLNYQGWVDDQVPLWGEWMKPQTSEERVRIWRDDYGINMLQLQDGGITITPRTQDLLIQMGAQFTTLNSLAGQHQPGGGAFDWSMPEVVVATRRQAQHAAQVGRRWPGFRGVHYADEPGLTYGTRKPDGTFEPYYGALPDLSTHYFGPLAVPAQFDLYTKTTGKPLPDLFQPQANLEAWLDYMRFRTTILGDVFAQYTADVHGIDPRLIGYSQLYAWMFLADGLYLPEQAKGVDVISSHAYIDHALGIWYPVHEADAMRDGNWNKPLWMMPSFEGMIRMPTVYGAIARKLEGLGWDRTTMLSVPETKVLAQRVVPISAMLHRVTKPRDSVAVFYSRDQYLVEIAKDIKNLMQGRDYASRLVAAWIMSNAAQCPAVRVVEEDLLTGLPKEHKVVIAPQLTYARPEIRAALEAFTAAGGTLLLDQTATLVIAGATKLPFAFVDWWSQAVPGSPGFENLTQGQIFERYIVGNLPAFKQALADKVTPLVESGDPWLLASQQLAEDGQYVWLVNMKHTTRVDFQALSTPVTLPKAAAIYDVFNRRLVPSESFPLSLAGGDAALYALMPARIESVGVQAVTAGVGRITVSATVKDAAGAVGAIIPVAVTLRDPSGALVKTFYRATKRGEYAETLPIGRAPLEGVYRVEVTELLSGLTAAAEVAPTAGTVAFAVTAAADVSDVKHLLRTVREHAQKPMLVLYGAEGDKAAADVVAEMLRQKEVQVTVDLAANHNKARTGWVQQLFYTAALYSEPVDLPSAAVLVGSTNSNPLIKRVVDMRLTPRPLTPVYPGPNRGLVWWVRSILGLDLDAILIYADDAQGLDRAVESLRATLQTGRPPVTVLAAQP